MGLTESCRRILKDDREVIMYLFFGGLTTIVSWASYALFVHLGIEINVSNILSWFCGVMFAFTTNKWFVFVSRSISAKTLLYELGSFFSARIFTGIVAWVLFPILIFIGLDQSLFNTDGFLAKIITSFVEIVLNWLFSKYVVFRKKDTQDTSEQNEQ